MKAITEATGAVKTMMENFDNRDLVICAVTVICICAIYNTPDAGAMHLIEKGMCGLLGIAMAKGKVV